MSINNSNDIKKNKLNLSNEQIKYLNTECKIFVGNVPYQCTQEEFEKCFEKIEGFVKAEIITMYKTNMSRGFGFITLKSLHDAEKLKHRNDIFFKGRNLRFTNYQGDTIDKLFDDNYNYKSIIDKNIIDKDYVNKKNIITKHVVRKQFGNHSLNNYVYVYGIPFGKNKTWLRESFSNYEPIGKCFISINHNTGEIKNNGIIEILDDLCYKSILSKKYHVIDDNILVTSSYKLKVNYINNYNNISHNFRTNY